MRFPLKFVGLALGLISTGPTTFAQTSEKDLQVAVRSIAFMDGAPQGATPVAVVFDPSVPASITDAEDIARIIKAGLAAGKATLAPTLLPTSQIGQLSQYPISFVASGTTNGFEAIRQLAASNRILTISSDRACVDTNTCVVGVFTSPKVEIIISSAQRQATGISFGSAFMMMVKEK